jgi:predicted transcriptional regulator
MQIPENLKKLLQMIEHTQEIEISCDDVYKLLDQYTEVVARGEEAQLLMPLVEHHIEICADCREEFEALLRILEVSSI